MKISTIAYTDNGMEIAGRQIHLKIVNLRLAAAPGEVCPNGLKSISQGMLLFS